MLRPCTCANTVAPKYDVRVPDTRFPEHAAMAIARAFGVGASGRLEVIDEPAHFSMLDEGVAAGGHAFVIHRTRHRPSRRERIVQNGEPRVEEHLPDFPRERRAALQ